MTLDTTPLQRGPSDTDIEIFELGDGPPVLVLHGLLGIGAAEYRFLEKLAMNRRTIAPSHPGFGRSSLPEAFDSVDDLAYFYLDLIEDMELDQVPVIGLSLGGWIAAEMAVRRPAALSKLVLVDAFGIHVGGREHRAIADIFALSTDDLARLAFHDPANAESVFDYPAMAEGEPERLLRNQEAVALYAWEPYLHSAKLLPRLPRVRVPTLVLWGSDDGIVGTDYGRAFSDALGNASFEVIDAAGHHPEREQPEVLAERIRRFLDAD